MHTRQNQYGEPVKGTGHDERDGLRGMAAISAYSGYGERSIKALVEIEGFPAAIIAGAWESSRSMIDEWRREQIKNGQKKVAA